MTIDEKIRKITYWIAHESESRFDEIEWLLYSIYVPTKSGLPLDIDKAYGDVIKLKRCSNNEYYEMLWDETMSGEEE